MIINPIEIIKNEIPKLNDIDYKSANNRKWLSWKQWVARLKSIERKNIDVFGHSISCSSLGYYFHECIYKTDSDDNSILINELAYKLIREFVTSEKFNN